MDVRKKREYALRELVETEAKFVRHMREVVDLYMKPLEDAVKSKDSKHILKPERITVAFSVIRQILNLSIPFLQDLREIDATDENFCIGKVMKPIAPYYKLYKVYASNHSNAMSLIERCSTAKPRFRDFLLSVAKDPRSSGQQLQSLLIMPIQRIPRLKMLLERLLKFTPPDHCDHEDLKVCLRSVCDVADTVNHGISEKENRIKVWEVQQRMVPPPPDLVKPHRIFVREGSLMKVCRRTDKSRHFFLFNDLLVYGPALTGNLVNYSNAIELRRAIDLRRERRGCAFAVFGVPKSFVLVAPSRAEKARWLNDLYRCCEGIERRRATVSSKANARSEDVFAKEGAPLWVPDNFSNVCMCCGAVKFSKFSLRNRRHHCRMCGVLVCGGCSRHKYMLPSVDSKRPVRVCDKCKNRATDSERRSDENAAFASAAIQEDDDDEFVFVEGGGGGERDARDVVDDGTSTNNTTNVNDGHRSIDVPTVLNRLRHRFASKGEADDEDEDDAPSLTFMQALRGSTSPGESTNFPTSAAVRSVPVLSSGPADIQVDRLNRHRPTSAALRNVPIMEAVSGSRVSVRVLREHAARVHVPILEDVQSQYAAASGSRRNSHRLSLHDKAKAAFLSAPLRRHDPTSPALGGSKVSASSSSYIMSPLSIDTPDATPCPDDDGKHSTIYLSGPPNMLPIEYDTTYSNSGSLRSHKPTPAAAQYAPIMQAVKSDRSSVRIRCSDAPAARNVSILLSDPPRDNVFSSRRNSHSVRRHTPAVASTVAAPHSRHCPVFPNQRGRVASWSSEGWMEPLSTERDDSPKPFAAIAGRQRAPLKLEGYRVPSSIKSPRRVAARSRAASNRPSTDPTENNASTPGVCTSTPSVRRALKCSQERRRLEHAKDDAKRVVIEHGMHTGKTAAHASNHRARAPQRRRRTANRRRLIKKMKGKSVL